MQLFAIRRVSDGKLMPSTRRPTQAEFDDYGAPRLFLTRAGALTALRMWRQGQWLTGKEWESTNEYGDGYYVQGLPAPVEGTQRNEEAEVVEVSLHIGEKN